MCLHVSRKPDPRYFVVRPPEGKCGSGGTVTTIWPAKVFVRTDSTNPDASPKCVLCVLGVRDVCCMWNVWCVWGCVRACVRAFVFVVRACGVWRGECKCEGDVQYVISCCVCAAGSRWCGRAASRRAFLTGS